MKQFSNGMAIVTGGASGIGLALARRLGQAGMRVSLLDIEDAAMEQALADLHGYQIEASAMHCDVADPAALERAIADTAANAGPVQIICNNAGVAAGGGLEDVPLGDWNWVVGVNMMSVVYGCRAVLPHMREHGLPSWIVNTASMAGMVGLPGMSPYCATKFAVVAMSEALRGELADTSIGVSVLCPGWVRTRIHDSRRNHPQPDAPSASLSDPEQVKAVRELIEHGMPPERVADRVVEAIEADEFYIFTHPDMGSMVEERSQEISRALGAAQRSAVLTGGT